MDAQSIKDLMDFFPVESTVLVIMRVYTQPNLSRIHPCSSEERPWQEYPPTK